MTTVEALKDLYVALGGELADVQDMSTNVAVLNAISAKYSGASDAVLNPEAVANIAAVADQIGGGGSGESDFSTAQVTFSGMWPPTTIFIGLVENRGISAVLPMGTQTLVLYNGSQVVPNIATDGTITATGDIEVSIDEGADYPTVTISGNGTLSISESSNP